MTGIAIYIEGGGDSRDGKSAIRQGFDALLAPQKNAARARKLRWRTVLCGGRHATFEAFAHATSNVSEVVALLVDAEEAVSSATPAGRIAHLSKRDGWSFAGIVSERVHLMTQCMEAWIVAEPERLAEFYGKEFQTNALPKRTVLDDEPKQALYASLKAATKDTQKGSYGKIKHASALLQLLRPQVVVARCMSFRHITQWLDDVIANA